MNVFQAMGCTSDQYASMEHYLVGKAKTLSENGSSLVVVYENTPKSASFIEDLGEAGGVLKRGKLQGIRDFSYYGQIRALIREWDIEIVHGYFTPTCHYLAVAFRLSGYANVVRTAANMPSFPSEGRPPLAVCLRQRMLALFQKRIICRSEGVAAAYRALGVPAWKIVVADGGCDTGFYTFAEPKREAFRKTYGLKPEDLALGVACRLVRQKRIENLLALMPPALAVEPNLRLLIAGDGPERTTMEKQVLDRSLQNVVRFLGHVDGLVDFYSAVDVFCLPSATEGMSNSILEAMSCERPVLASDIPPNRGLVTPEGGFLLGFDDPAGFVNALRDLRPADVRRRMGKHNRRLVETRYSLQSRIEKELAIYEAVLEEGPGSKHESSRNASRQR